MVTRNFKALLAQALQSSAAVKGELEIFDVNGLARYLTSGSSFPSSRTSTFTNSASSAGISIGTGTTPATENDWNLESTITSGVNVSVTDTVAEMEADESPVLTYKLTVTNTGSAPITVAEIGYKQSLQAVTYPGYATGASGYVALIDRTVLSPALTIAAGDAAVIEYKLKTTTPFVHTKSGVKCVSWTYGTDEEVAAMIDAARLGTIDLQTDGGWRVGDIRLVTIGAFTGGNNVSCPEQVIPIAISSFSDYNGCGAIMQIDWAAAMSKSFRMNSSNTTTGGYGATEMYNTTIPALVAALPSWLSTRLKTFSVLCSKGGSELETIETVGGNKLALRSEIEIFGTNTYSKPGEGSQIPYYNKSGTANKVKTTGIAGGAAHWWERSPSSSTTFCSVTGSGTANSYIASNASGLAPFGCI